MALSAQNKNFLAVLNKLNIDAKQFPDETFDGLFENIPDITNYFFNWFMENITSDNVLTRSEEAIYFHLESTQSLPTDEEVDFVLSSTNFTYEELMSLDVNYVENFLPQELDDLDKNHAKLYEIFADAESSYNNIIKKENCLKEVINSKKEQLRVMKEDCENSNALFLSKVNEVKMFLLKEPKNVLDLDVLSNLLETEENIFSQFKNSKLLETKFSNCSIVDMLTSLEDDLTCVEISGILSKGFLKEKKTKIDFLTELNKKKKASNNYSFMQYSLMYKDGDEFKIRKEIKLLESELFEKQKKLSHREVQKISDQYMLSKIELNNCHIQKLTQCRDYLKSNWKINLCLIHILLSCITCLENALSIRKQLYSKLNEWETSFSNDITNLELRRQRYKDVSLHQDQHPFFSALRNIVNLEENPESNEETLKQVMELMFHANDDSNFITHKFRNELQSSFKAVFSHMLCGPTNQVLLAPLELLIKFQNCEEHKNQLSQMLKRLASKYVDAKETISKSDRNKLLSWIEFLINPQKNIQQLPQS